VKKIKAKLNIELELEVEDNATPADMQTVFNEEIGQIMAAGQFENLMQFTDIRKVKNKAGKITLDELADNRANNENVRLALNELERGGLVIKSNKPDHWIALRQ
jgi:uncharacterized protein YqfB (UPF0267 family)